MTVTLEALHGRVLDTDSHEQVPVPRWGEVFGERAQRFAETSSEWFNSLKKSSFMGSEVKETDGFHLDVPDDIEITPETMWENKGVIGPSAINLDRRPAAMDVMGFRRELVFPLMGLAAIAVATGGSTFPATEEQMKAAEGAIDAYNEWAAALTRKYPDRLRPSAVLNTWRADITPEGLVKSAETLIASGIRVLQITTTVPPAGVSPAAPELDPFYALLAQENIALITHPHQQGRNAGLIAERWLRARGVSFATPNEVENFIGSMVLGGVFERHPTLRFGAIEHGSHWIGPLADRMDHAADASARFFKAMGINLSLKPSEYLARNVRVSALLDDPVERWLARYPAIQDCYCYSSDFPHIEGRPYSLKAFYERVSPLGDTVVEKFFCQNASLLLPA